MKDKAFIYALHNAVKFDGKANPGAVIGQLFSESPDLKSKAKEVAMAANAAVKEVNSLSLEEQLKKLKKLAPELLEKKEKKKKELPELKNAVKGKVVTRLAPEPSKYLHIGHALSFLINYLYAKKYDGKCVLRFEDTNPEKAELDYYKSTEEDIKWLKIKTSKKVIVSDDMPKMYKYGEKLIDMDEAYTCTCSREDMQEMRQKGVMCNCRQKSKLETKNEWENMLAGKYKEGSIVLRLKGQMGDNNFVMRDPVLFRIVTKRHVLQGTKYKVWPMYDLANAVEEHLCGVTHVMRSSEFGQMRVELQDYIKDLLKLNKQEVRQYSRFNIAGAITKGREIREMIKKKKVSGWDDPRLVTVKALRRRGIVPEAFYELAVEVGLSNSTSNLDFSVIASINRKIIDPEVNRYFFVENPKKIVVKGAPKLNVKVDLHPDFPKRGKRNFKTHEAFYIADELKKGKIYRFMHLFNFKNNNFISQDYDPKIGAKLIHWIPVGEETKAEILMPDGSVKKGYADKNSLKLKLGDVIQFERFGFCRLDDKKKDRLVFVYAHD
jgi:glutamyl-tRNA synthetase